MDKEIIKLFVQRKILLRNLQDIDLGVITTKRCYKCYLGIDLKGFYTILIIRNAKSKFLAKDFTFLKEIYAFICKKTGISIKKLIFFYNSEICSKVLKLFGENGWKAYDFV